MGSATYNAPITARRVADIDRGIASHTLNFRIPADRCRGDLEVRLTIFDAAHPQEAGYTSLPVTRTLRFMRAAPLRIRLVRIRYRNEARGMDIPAPTVDDFWTTAEYTLRTYPIHGIELVAESEELYDGDFTGLFDAPPGAVGTTGSVFTIIDDLQKAEGRVGDAQVKYFALIPGAPANQSGALGWGVAPNRAVGEVFKGPVMAQEIGHMCYRDHAPCGVSPADPNYPAYDNYPSASIGEFGFDVVTSAVYDPANSYDFMSYCLNNAWVSPYTYEALMNCFPTFSVAGEIVCERRELLYLSFTIYRDGAVKMRGPGFHLKGYLGAPSGQSTPYFVELHDEKGLILEAQRLRLNDVHRSLDDASLDFLAAIPWHTQASIVVFKREEQVLHSVEIGKAVPEVEITSPKGGGTLTGKQKIAWAARSGEGEFTYILRYSNDGGQSWRAMATGLMTNEFTVDLDGLPGGEKCVFQVLASAGIRTGAASSDPFAVPRKPLKPSIISPHNGDTFVQGDSVHLFGVASSPGGDSARDEMMNWSSSIDGSLGSGSQLIVHSLSVGRHCITLRTDDTCGGEESKNVYVTMKPTESR